jgi:DNA-binding transcriptional MerR regulator
MTDALTIQQAAATSGLSVHTLRYYERIGLIKPVARRGNGHRRYRQADLEWIAFLLRLRATGMPVAEMLRYAQLREQGQALSSISQRKRMLAEHAGKLETQIATLSETLDYLRRKVSVYTSMEQQLEQEGRHGHQV